jgi:hypothetical protein
MRTHSATATHEGRWWVVDVPGVGVTQGRTAREAERMAADLVAVMLDVPVEEVSITVDFRLVGELAEEVRSTKQAQIEAEAAQREAADRSRKVVRRVLAAGLSKQDAARVLGISAQRVSQLIPDGHRTSRAKAKNRQPHVAKPVRRASV